MKKLVTLLLCLAMIATMAFSLVGCVDNSTDSNSGSDSTPPASEEPETSVFVDSVDLPRAIKAYNYNSVEVGHENEETVFFETGRAYQVGDDNPFRFKPTVVFVDDLDIPVTAPAEWTYSYTLVQVTENGEVAATDGEWLDAVDSANSTYDFAETAIGKTFKLSVCPDGLTEEQQTNIANYTVSFTFEVIDGYNAYEDYDLAYINNVTEENIQTEDKAHKLNLGWASFREEHGLTLNPDDVKAVILHNDIELVKESVPSTFFYTAEETAAFNDNFGRITGSLKDESSGGIYYRVVKEQDTFSFIGNYFTLDTQNFPVVYYTGANSYYVVENDIVTESNICSHATLFRFQGNDKSSTEYNETLITVKDINLIGNSPKSEDLKVQGGLIFSKTQRANVNFDNVISKCYFITAFAEMFSHYNVSNMKCFDSFNAPIYNWGCEDMNFTNCIVKNAGGPAIIADAVDDKVGDFFPRIIATDCDFDNPVNAESPWFIMALDGESGGLVSSSVLVPQIMALDAVCNPFGRTFLESVNETTKMFNVYCVIIDRAGSFSYENKAYVEINGSVLDYGIGAKQGDKCNGGNDPVYGPTLNGTLQQACAEEGAPVFESAGGGIIYYTGKQQAPVAEAYNMVKMAQGDAVNLYYDTDNFMGILGIMFEYNAIAVA